MNVGMHVHEGTGTVRRVVVALMAAAALTGTAAEATAHSGDPAAAPTGATITARVGEQVGVALSADGAVTDASTVPARVIRERRDGVLVVTIV